MLRCAHNLVQVVQMGHVMDPNLFYSGNSEPSFTLMCCVENLVHDCKLDFYFHYSGDSTPSSNSYSLPNQLGTNVPVKNASAAYTMTGRSYTGGFAEDFAKTPGPGAYDMVRPSTYTRNAPAYSMQGRSTIPGGEQG